MANYILNQEGKEIVAWGAAGSHIRNKEQFNITMPKLLDRLFKNWAYGGLDRHTEPRELFEIMDSDNVPKENQQSLYSSAYFYFTQLKSDNSIFEQAKELIKN